MTTVRLDDQLCFALHAASRALTGAYREPLTRLGLTYPQYLVLMALWESDGPSVTELGLRLKLDSGTLSPLLKRMQVQGLVERRPSAADERRVHVHLTAAGRELGDHAESVQQCLVETIDLDDSEFATLLTLARRVASLDHTSA
ncbi:transcriptional regulator, MarR family [Aeromicrobium marinum DSM 15272]|uniref:Transcriptional regulator, MarR family n=1 Tax=Aeromicrobium marinum DSM 15272 TaxID=585531 RepID=E2SAI4_9ACTN|nr:MarR family transcriptional regulator [Aeromicrobium marinum]EFQ84258.1 transcriptional regulator, MarR family [Aeromicrobium marinum DSM 15272]